MLMNNSMEWFLVHSTQWFIGAGIFAVCVIVAPVLAYIQLTEWEEMAEEARNYKE